MEENEEKYFGAERNGYIGGKKISDLTDEEFEYLLNKGEFGTPMYDALVNKDRKTNNLFVTPLYTFNSDMRPYGWLKSDSEKKLDLEDQKNYLVHLMQKGQEAVGNLGVGIGLSLVGGPGIKYLLGTRPVQIAFGVEGAKNFFGKNGFFRQTLNPWSDYYRKPTTSAVDNWDLPLYLKDAANTVANNPVWKFGKSLGGDILDATMIGAGAHSAYTLGKDGIYWGDRGLTLLGNNGARYRTLGREMDAQLNGTTLLPQSLRFTKNPGTGFTIKVNKPNLVSTINQENRFVFNPKTGTIDSNYNIAAYPGYQLKVLMKGSPLEKSLSKTGLVSINSINAAIKNASDVEKEVINKVLQEKFAGQTKIDYNQLKKAVLDELVTFTRKPQTKYADYGMNRIGYRGEIHVPNNFSGYMEVMEYSFPNRFLKINSTNFLDTKTGSEINMFNYHDYDNELILKLQEADIPDLNTFTLESPKMLVGNAKHYDPTTLAHSRTFTLRKDPEVLYILEGQSDLAQARGISGVDSAALRTIKKYKTLLLDLKSDIETGKVNFGEEENNLISKLIDDELNSGFFGDELKIKSVYSPTISEKYFYDSYLRKILLENLKFAAETGRTKMRYPTRETAIKIEGYTPEPVMPEHVKRSNNNADMLEYLLNRFRDTHLDMSGIAFDPDGNIKYITDVSGKTDIGLDSSGQLIRVPKGTGLNYHVLINDDKINKLLEDFPSIPITDEFKQYKLINNINNNLNRVSPRFFANPRTALLAIPKKYETILKKYDEFPNMFKKLYKDSEVRIVNDDKGNTWYEVDVPKDYLTSEWLYKKGGVLKAQGGLSLLRKGVSVINKLRKPVQTGSKTISVGSKMVNTEKLGTESSYVIPFLLGTKPMFTTIAEGYGHEPEGFSYIDELLKGFKHYDYVRPWSGGTQTLRYYINEDRLKQTIDTYRDLYASRLGLTGDKATTEGLYNHLMEHPEYLDLNVTGGKGMHDLLGVSLGYGPKDAILFSTGTTPSAIETMKARGYDKSVPGIYNILKKHIERGDIKEAISRSNGNHIGFKVKKELFGGKFKYYIKINEDKIKLRF